MDRDEENERGSSPTGSPNGLRSGLRPAKQLKMNSVSPLEGGKPLGRQPWALRSAGAGLLLAVIGAGCGREEIQVYTAPRETREKAATVANGKPRPRVAWTLPKDWKEVGAGQMSVASFSIAGSGGADAQVTITPLAKLAGRDTEIVNMWREQVGQEPLSREEAVKQFVPVVVGGEPGNLFEISGVPQEGSPAARIVTAMVHRSDASWFYKLAGDAALVEVQKPAFIEFLKTIRITDGPPASEMAGHSHSAARPNWSVPAQWKELPAGQMQVAKFAVPERSGATGEVFVSVFPGDTGGLLANVNRWRTEIGLAAADDAEAARVVSALDPARPEAKLIDMTNNNRRLIAAIVPRDGSYWFYKLRGDADAVTPEREAFVNFAKSMP
jgi:hypothetical protein